MTYNPSKSGGRFSNSASASSSCALPRSAAGVKTGLQADRRKPAEVGECDFAPPAPGPEDAEASEVGEALSPLSTEEGGEASPSTVSTGLLGEMRTFVSFFGES